MTTAEQVAEAMNHLGQVIVALNGYPLNNPTNSCWDLDKSITLDNIATDYKSSKRCLGSHVNAVICHRFPDGSQIVETRHGWCVDPRPQQIPLFKGE